MITCSYVKHGARHVLGYGKRGIHRTNIEAVFVNDKITVVSGTKNTKWHSFFVLAVGENRWKEINIFRHDNA